MKAPSIPYPTLAKGEIHGPIRCESMDGTELWLPPRSGRLMMRPFYHEGRMFCVSHLQKKATYFSLLYDPFIYHFGKYWHLQEQEENGAWKPGTEQGIYFRTPGWRWQIPDEKSGGTPWIWSWGRVPGMHLD